MDYLDQVAPKQLSIVNQYPLINYFEFTLVFMSMKKLKPMFLILILPLWPLVEFLDFIWDGPATLLSWLW